MDDRIMRSRDIILGELDRINQKGNLTSEALCNVDKMVDILKDVQEMEIMEMEAYPESYVHGMPGYYYQNQATNRARQGGSSREYRTGNQYGNQYGSGKYQMIDHLQRALDMAQTEQERESIRRMIEQAR